MTDNITKPLAAKSADSLVVTEPLVCPLCHQTNACLHVSCTNTAQACWCHDPKISFPEGLLAKLAAEQRGQACICHKCVTAYQIKA